MEETSASPLNARTLFYPCATSVCNKYFYNLGAKYSCFRHWSPMGMRKRQFSVIFPTACNAMIYVLRIISSSPQTLRKATQVASFCLKTRMFALRGWVVCASQLHELSPKSGASAPQNPHIRTICRTICHCQASKTRFSKVKISSRIRRFSVRVCNVVDDVSHVATVAMRLVCGETPHPLRGRSSRCRRSEFQPYRAKIDCKPRHFISFLSLFQKISISLQSDKSAGCMQMHEAEASMPQLTPSLFAGFQASGQGGRGWVTRHDIIKAFT